MKKILIIATFLCIVLSSCNSSEAFLKKGYRYNVTKEPATVQKVWMPRYVKYHKKQDRFSFVNGHYRIVLDGQASTYRKARMRNRFGNL